MEFEVTATVVFRVSYVVTHESAVNQVIAIPERARGDLPDKVKIVRIIGIQKPVTSD